MWAIFHSLKVFGRRGPSPGGIEEVFLRRSVERIIGNLVFLKATLIADAAAVMIKIEFSCCAITHRPYIIFFAHRLHERR